MRTIHEFELFPDDLDVIIEGLKCLKHYTILANIFTKARERVAAEDIVAFSVSRGSGRT